MKNKLKIIVSFLMALLIGFNASFCAYASDHGGGGTTDTKRDLLKAQESVENRERVESFIKEHFTDAWGFFVYAASQIGCVVTGQYKDAYDSWLTMEDILNSDIGIYVDQNNKADGLYISADLMTQIKNLIDDYAKENEPYYIVPISSYRDIDPSSFTYKAMYSTICQLARSYGLISVNGGGSYVYISDMSDVASKGHSFVCTYIPSNTNWSTTECWASMYNSNWQGIGSTVKIFHFDANMTVGYTSFDDGETLGSNYNFTWHSNFGINSVVCRKGRIKSENSSISDFVSGSLVAKESQRIRVYKTVDDYKRYSVGKRSVYYTENYYNYVPDDLTTSIDDLQKSVDDLQDVVDKLTDQIGNDTSESEIEELLKQILEELRNGGGSGGGGGSGDIGDVSDKLSGIYTVVSHIFTLLNQSVNKLQTSVDSILGEIRFSIQETLDEILSTLRTISGDVSDIKGQLENMSEQEFNEKSDSFLGEIMDAFSEISEVVKTKFPFSIPNDLRIFLSKIAPAPPETEEQQMESYSLDSSSGMTLYSGEHGGGGTSDGETNSPGGGGSSRPGSGFVDVEHGGGGGSRDPVEMREAPVFCLPIVIERYGIEEYIIIDMSPFDPLSRFSRSFFTIIFMVCLFNLTFKVIGMWGDLIG